MVDIAFIAGRKVIDADHFRILDELIAEMRADETGAADDEHVLLVKNRLLGHMVSGLDK